MNGRAHKSHLFSDELAVIQVNLSEVDGLLTILDFLRTTLHHLELDDG